RHPDNIAERVLLHDAQPITPDAQQDVAVAACGALAVRDDDGRAALQAKGQNLIRVVRAAELVPDDVEAVAVDDGGAGVAPAGKVRGTEGTNAGGGGVEGGCEGASGEKGGE
ncbi:MAG: hypothetical protein Q9216_006067, partial [Gyalolechia sp. 2 TL-2023]